MKLYKLLMQVDYINMRFPFKANDFKEQHCCNLEVNIDA
jgi:hypothetical protein